MGKMFTKRAISFAVGIFVSVLTSYLSLSAGITNSLGGIVSANVALSADHSCNRLGLIAAFQFTAPVFRSANDSAGRGFTIAIRRSARSFSSPGFAFTTISRLSAKK